MLAPNTAARHAGPRSGGGNPPRATTKDQYCTPRKLRLDERAVHLAAGATWNERSEEHAVAADGTGEIICRADQWQVEAEAESVQVPAGTFSCPRLRRTSPETASDKTCWFARGVEKVKEAAGGQTGELAAYSAP